MVRQVGRPQRGDDRSLSLVQVLAPGLARLPRHRPSQGKISAAIRIAIRELTLPYVGPVVSPTEFRLNVQYPTALQYCIGVDMGIRGILYTGYAQSVFWGCVKEALRVLLPFKMKLTVCGQCTTLREM